ncbi:uncharacterized protein LOC141855018 isoform X2 [Brevipalpus obovatus]|uniref:uncharacterized protein LOC141855018 isoform X2 n=1 Tax=Brevipalpus obovatus TaxID=246614 RepID=UPI003D9EC949
MSYSTDTDLILSQFSRLWSTLAQSNDEKWTFNHDKNVTKKFIERKKNLSTTYYVLNYYCFIIIIFINQLLPITAIADSLGQHPPPPSSSDTPISSAYHYHQQYHSHKCIKEYVDTKFGILTTPNFPSQFAIPFHCTWIIRAQLNEVITLFFTQFYLREGFTGHEYAFYMNESVNLGGNLLTPDYFEHPPDLVPLVTSKPVLVIKVDIEDDRNVYLRGLDFLLDVYGFNITYRIDLKSVEKSIKTTPTSTTNQTCNPFTCSLNGQCLMTSNYQHFYCECFAPFSGHLCHNGPDCDPKKDINPCKNNGICRYYAGNRFIRCDCPPGFSGEHCTHIPVNLTQNDCNDDSCTPSCPHDVGSRNNVSLSGGNITLSSGICAPPGSARFLITIKVLDANTDMKRINKAHDGNVKHGLETAIINGLKPYLHPTESHLRIIKFKSESIVDFHFYHLESEEKIVRQLLVDKLRLGLLGPFRVDKNFFRFTKEPALNIIHIGMNGQAIEDAPLVINCIIVGSSSLKVKWLKDSVEINFRPNSLRSISSTFVQEVSSKGRPIAGRYRATLTISKLVYPIDDGIFTCEARDWEFSASMSIPVEIIIKPTIILTPLSQTVAKGSAVQLFCFTTDNFHQPQWLGYNWLREGQMLSQASPFSLSNGPATIVPKRVGKVDKINATDRISTHGSDIEVIEDLYPTGTRLMINDAQVSVTYTCLVTTPWGTVFKQSVLTVLPGNTSEFDSVKTCPVNFHQNIVWPETAIESIAIEPCPPHQTMGSDQAVIRHCLPSGEWEIADLSSCVNHQLQDIRNKLMTIALGYPIRSHSSIMNRLKDFLIDGTILPRQGNIVIDILTLLMDAIKLTSGSSQAHESAQIGLDVISILLDRPDSIDSRKGLSSLHNLITQLSMAYAGRSDQEFQRIARSNFVVEIMNFSGIRQSFNEHNLSVNSGNFPTYHQTNSNSDASPKWLNDKVHFQLPHMEKEGEGIESLSTPSQIRILTVFYQNLTQFLPKNIMIRKEYEEIEFMIYSRVVGVALIHQRDDFEIININLPVRTIAHLQHISVAEKSSHHHQIDCGIAQFDKTFSFQTKHCQTSTRSSSTVCTCDIIGAYAVLITTQVPEYNQSQALLFGSLIFSLLILTTIAILFLKRSKNGVLVWFKLQICFALTGLSISLIGLTMPRTFIPWLSSSTMSLLAVYFYLSAQCLQLCLCLATYVLSVGKLSRKKGRPMPHLLLSLTGWAIPLSLASIIVLIKQIEWKSDAISNKRMQIEDFTLLSISIISSALLFIQVVLVLTFRISLRLRSKHTQMEEFKISYKIFDQSLMISVLLMLYMFMIIFFIDWNAVLIDHLVAIISSLCGLIIFVTYSAPTNLNTDSEESFHHHRSIVTDTDESKFREPEFIEYRMGPEEDINKINDTFLERAGAVMLYDHGTTYMIDSLQTGQTEICIHHLDTEFISDCERL